MAIETPGQAEDGERIFIGAVPTRLEAPPGETIWLRGVATKFDARIASRSNVT